MATFAPGVGVAGPPVPPDTVSGSGLLGTQANQLGAAGLPATAGLPLVECHLDGAHDLASLLSALQLREREQKDQRVFCEASARGLKFTAVSNSKDVQVCGWMLTECFKEFRFSGGAEVVLKLPIAQLLHCLQIFSDRALLILRYPAGPGSSELGLRLEEDGAVTECWLRTLSFTEVPTAMMGSFLAAGNSIDVFRPSQAEAWFQALSEFAELDSTDVVLSVSLRVAATGVSLVLRAQTITSDAEVELPQSAFDELELCDQTRAAGQVTHCYLLSGVLASCRQKDAKGVKVRFNSDGTMSNQFILRGRGGMQRDLLCEATVCPLAGGARERARGVPGAGFGSASTNFTSVGQGNAGSDSMGF